MWSCYAKTFIEINTQKYTSGHTATAIGFYGMLAIILWHEKHYVMGLLSAVWILLVGFSRVYIGVHYPSDVIAALAFGSLWIGLLLLTFDYFNLGVMGNPKSIHKRPEPGAAGCQSDDNDLGVSNHN